MKAIVCVGDARLIEGTKFVTSNHNIRQRVLAIQHLFEQVSLKRELHIAGMLLRRGNGVARLGKGVGGQAAKAARCSGDDDNFLGHGRFLSISK